MVFMGSAREGRLGERVAKLVKRKLETKKAEVFYIDPLTLNLPIVTQPIQFMKDPSTASDILKKYHEEIKNADGYFLISAEYNGAICPGLTNCIDYFPPPAYKHKPFAISTYSAGPFGGTIAGSQLRQVVSVLGGFPLPGSFTIPSAYDQVSEDGQGNERIEKNADKIVDLLLWYAEAMIKHKEENPTPN